MTNHIVLRLDWHKEEKMTEELNHRLAQLGTAYEVVAMSAMSDEVIVIAREKTFV
jgi:hypothetical protein